ncbi:hypothetical protein Psi01_14690 [Planobispora siamensis]|uniref:Uncharacterized protein n=1 Tax=Planobispora siamensis TaxID=936338 RepID=A0A8J3SCI5_9ACTN|nr:hypothetical protein Psi01_14690 [Planobispora siamensis]
MRAPATSTAQILTRFMARSWTDPLAHRLDPSGHLADQGEPLATRFPSFIPANENNSDDRHAGQKE